MPATEVTKDAMAVNLFGGPGLDAPGDRIDYEITVSVDEDEPADTYSLNVAIDDSLVDLTLASGDTNMNGLLDTGEMWVYTGSYELTQADLDADSQIENTVDVTLSGSYDPTGPTAPRSVVLEGSESAVEFLTLNPEIELLKDGVFADVDMNGIDVGDELRYTFTVTNTGNVTLTNVTVEDVFFDLGMLDINGGPIASLAPGASDSTTFTATYVLTQDDVDFIAENCEGATLDINNLAVVFGTPMSGGPNVDDEDDATVAVPCPAAEIDLEKLVSVDGGLTFVDADTPTGPLARSDIDPIFRYVVSNDGDTTLFNLVVTDDAGTPGDPADDFNPTFVSGDTDGDGNLDVDETWTFQATRPWRAGQYTNLAVAAALDPAGNPVEDDDPANYFGAAPDIDIVKSGSFNDENGDGFAQPGETISYQYSVTTGTSNVPILNVVVTDDAGTPGDPADDFNPTFVGGDTDGDNILDLTETWTYSATVVIDEADIDAGGITNIACAEGEDAVGQEVEDCDPETVTLTPPPDQPAGANTPGFWKNHPAIFEAVTGLDPDEESYVNIFGLEGTECADRLGDITLQEALEARGGGLNALARHSTAAYANAESPITDYTYVGFEGALSSSLDVIELIDLNDDGVIDTDEVVNAVQDVCDVGGAESDFFDLGDIEDVKDAFDLLNNVLPEIEKGDLLMI